MGITFSIGQHYEMIQRLVEWEVSGKVNSIQSIQESWRIEKLQKDSKDHKTCILWWQDSKNCIQKL